jgi:Flp pilus assembly protein TadB
MQVAQPGSLATNDMAYRENLRASDADRELVAERLRKAAAEGRLLAEELEQRLGETFKSRTYGELDAVVADLPSDGLSRRSGRTASALGRPATVAALVLAAVAVAAVAVLIVTGLLAMWAIWALLAWWMFGGRCMRRRQRVLRHGRWQVHGVGHQAERRAWL